MYPSHICAAMVIYIIQPRFTVSVTYRPMYAILNFTFTFIFNFGVCISQKPKGKYYRPKYSKHLHGLDCC